MTDRYRSLLTHKRARRHVSYTKSPSTNFMYDETQGYIDIVRL